MHPTQFLTNFLTLNPDPQAIDRRLKARLSLWEFLGLLVCCAMLGIFIWLNQIGSSYPPDFKIYLVGRSDPDFFYGYWLLPVLDVLKLLPFQAAYLVWGLANIFALLFTVRVFGGKPLLVLLSYQVFSLLYYGQISGIIAGGCALLWWGIAHRNWSLAGLGLLIAATKYQVGLPICLLLIWYAGVSWKEFARILVVPAVIGIISLIVYPLWPLEVIQKLNAVMQSNLGITLWILIGAWSLLFWIPPLLLPLSKPQRFLAILATSCFAVPYFQHIDLITLFSFPLGWLPLIGQIGWLFPLLNTVAIRLIVIFPLWIYLGIILPALASQARSFVIARSKT